MTEAVSWLNRFFQHEQVDFPLTNRIPRRWTTLFMGWFSRIEHPAVRKASLAIWQLFAGRIDFSEAGKREFTSLHDRFIRELEPAARPRGSTRALPRAWRSANGRATTDASRA